MVLQGSSSETPVGQTVPTASTVQTKESFEVCLFELWVLTLFIIIYILIFIINILNINLDLYFYFHTKIEKDLPIATLTVLFQSVFDIQSDQLIERLTT